MKLPGQYYDHPTLGWVEIPQSVMLNGDEYGYYPGLGFVKKLRKKIRRKIKSRLKKIHSPIAKVHKAVSPRFLRRIGPGATLNPWESSLRPPGNIGRMFTHR